MTGCAGDSSLRHLLVHPPSPGRTCLLLAVCRHLSALWVQMPKAEETEHGAEPLQSQLAVTMLRLLMLCLTYSSAPSADHMCEGRRCVMVQGSACNKTLKVNALFVCLPCKTSSVLKYAVFGIFQFVHLKLIRCIPC